MVEGVANFGGFRYQFQLGGVGAIYLLRPEVFHVKGFKHVPPAAAKTQNQEALKSCTIFARVEPGQFVDFRAVDLNFAVGEEYVFGRRWIVDLRRHLNFVPGAAEGHGSLLKVVFVHHFLILIPDEVRLGGAEVSRDLVHPAKNTLQLFRAFRRGSYLRGYDENGENDPETQAQRTTSQY